MKTSKVGIFYLINGRIVSENAPVSKIEPLGAVYSYPREHWTLWSELQDNDPDLNGMDWRALPRGRVVYNGKTRKFDVVADRHILEEDSAIASILKDFHLEKKEVQFSVDEIYKCSSCEDDSEV
jgi:hypothetical protein